MNDREKIRIIDLYEAIKDVQDMVSRNVLYLEFVEKYFNECYKVLK